MTIEGRKKNSVRERHSAQIDGSAETHYPAHVVASPHDR